MVYNRDMEENLTTAEQQNLLASQNFPQLRAVATAFPSTWFTQDQVLEKFAIKDPKIVSLFRGGGIDGRALSLPDADHVDSSCESQGQLLTKHRRVGLELASSAISDAVVQAGMHLDDVGYLCCVTSTGFMAPGMSAYLIKELNLSRNCGRIDVVGMGCNAGLNGLIATTAWSAQHPGEVAVLVCVEVCSAAYVLDETMRSAVVNSLFGDGAAAAVIQSGGDNSDEAPRIMDFSSLLVHEAISAMRFDWDEDHGKFSFFVAKETPYVVGAHIEAAVGRLLTRSQLKVSDIDHWVVHSGGKKVVDSITYNLGLSKNDLRHTRSVLRDHGNVSSGSFLVSYKELIEEGTVRAGDLGVFITMGPGSTIETALISW